MAEEKQFLGTGAGRMWTYLIMLGLLIVGALVANLVFSNPAAAKHGVHTFVGLPTWALVAVAFLIGAVVFWLGLKMETDWPEAIGGFIIAGSVAATEIIVGWKHFELGGLFVVPYLIPVLVFLGLLVYGVKKSV
ncbi:MAG: hypothetical protein IPL61_36325 [Myxococcales bacterium]|nr:hypothetical protein [Myxococcales bacterium]